MWPFQFRETCKVIKPHKMSWRKRDTEGQMEIKGEDTVKNGESERQREGGDGKKGEIYVWI